MREARFRNHQLSFLPSPPPPYPPSTYTSSVVCVVGTSCATVDSYAKSWTTVGTDAETFCANDDDDDVSDDSLPFDSIVFKKNVFVYQTGGDETEAM